MFNLPIETVSTAHCNTTSFQNSITPSARPAEKFTTEELAGLLRIIPQTIPASLCRRSHYLGLKPLKHQYGRLLWHAAEAKCRICATIKMLIVRMALEKRISYKCGNALISLLRLKGA